MGKFGIVYVVTLSNPGKNKVREEVATALVDFPVKLAIKSIFTFGVLE